MNGAHSTGGISPVAFPCSGNLRMMRNGAFRAANPPRGPLSSPILMDTGLYAKADACYRWTQVPSQLQAGDAAGHLKWDFPNVHGDLPVPSTCPCPEREPRYASRELCSWDTQPGLERSPIFGSGALRGCQWSARTASCTGRGHPAGRETFGRPVWIHLGRGLKPSAPQPWQPRQGPGVHGLATRGLRSERSAKSPPALLRLSGSLAHSPRPRNFGDRGHLGYLDQAIVQARNMFLGAVWCALCATHTPPQDKVVCPQGAPP